MAVPVKQKETRFMFMVDPTTGDLIRNRKLLVGGIKGEGEARALAFISPEEEANFTAYVNRSKKNNGTLPTLLEGYDNLVKGLRASGKPRLWQQEGSKGSGKTQDKGIVHDFLTSLLVEKGVEVNRVPGGIEFEHEGVVRLVRVK